MMFSFIKGKLSLISISVLAICVAIIKFLLWRNKKNKERIGQLQNKLIVMQASYKDVAKRTAFEATQKIKSKPLQEESHLNNLDKKRGPISNEKDNRYTTVKR